MGLRAKPWALGCPPFPACPATHQACTPELRPGNWFQRGSCCLWSQGEAVRTPGREGGRMGGCGGGGGWPGVLLPEHPQPPPSRRLTFPSSSPSVTLSHRRNWKRKRPCLVIAYGRAGGAEDKGPVLEPRPGRKPFVLAGGCGEVGWRAAPRPGPQPRRESKAPPHHMSLPAPRGGVFPGPAPARPRSPARWQGMRGPAVEARGAPVPPGLRRARRAGPPPGMGGAGGRASRCPEPAAPGSGAKQGRDPTPGCGRREASG